MPVRVPEGLRRLADAKFKQAAYEVMEVVFAVHNECGRLFDEQIYQIEIARRLSNAQTRVPLEIWFESFRKTYYLDLLYGCGTVFELKASERIVDRNRAQLINYLLILELPHGKIANLRTESVQHEFVNAPLTRATRTGFEVVYEEFKESPDSPVSLIELFVPMLRDWGTSLELGLYKEAMTHFLGGEEQVLKTVAVVVGDKRIGSQRFRILAPGVAIIVTGFESEATRYEAQLRQQLDHTELTSFQWVNIARRTVTFKTLTK